MLSKAEELAAGNLNDKKLLEAILQSQTEDALASLSPEALRRVALDNSLDENLCLCALKMSVTPSPSQSTATGYADMPTNKECSLPSL